MKSKIILLLMLPTYSVFAQIEKPVKWSYFAKKTGSGDAVLYIKATIEDRWHIYSQNVLAGGPVKTSFQFQPSKEFIIVGKPIEPKAIVKYEPTFKMNVGYFEKQVTFVQKIKLKKGLAAVKAKVEYMACNDKQCLPPEEVELNIPVR